MKYLYVVISLWWTFWVEISNWIQTERNIALDFSETASYNLDIEAYYWTKTLTESSISSVPASSDEEFIIKVLIEGPDNSLHYQWIPISAANYISGISGETKKSIETKRIAKCQIVGSDAKKITLKVVDNSVSDTHDSTTFVVVNMEQNTDNETVMIINQDALTSANIVYEGHPDYSFDRNWENKNNVPQEPTYQLALNRESTMSDSKQWRSRRLDAQCKVKHCKTWTGADLDVWTRCELGYKRTDGGKSCSELSQTDRMATAFTVLNFVGFLMIAIFTIIKIMTLRLVWIVIGQYQVILGVILIGVINCKEFHSF